MNQLTGIDVSSPEREITTTSVEVLGEGTIPVPFCGIMQMGRILAMLMFPAIPVSKTVSGLGE
jgi:hypothetical protein